MALKDNQRFWLTTGREEMVIGASPERIYDLVADMPRMGEWSPECQQVEWTDESTGPEKDATFVGHNKGGPRGLMKWSRHGRVLEADRGRVFAFVTQEGARESTEWRYSLEAVEGGTRVTESYNVWWIPTWARILDVPTNRYRELHENMRTTLARLKEVAETAPANGVR